MKLKKALLLIALFICVLNAIHGENLIDVSADVNKDIFLVIDKSLSMYRTIDEVKKYINESIIDVYLKPGDSFTMITFFGEAHAVVVDDNVEQSEIQDIKNKLNSLTATGKYTDIGNALDLLKKVIAEKNIAQDPQRPPLFLLITDGMQDAPMSSKYYSPDQRFNHAFLENAKDIKMKGWKVQILSIGSSTIGKELSEETSGEYIEVGEDATAEEMKKANQDFDSYIKVTQDPQFKPVDKKGNSSILITVKSVNYPGPKAVNISKIKLDTDSGSQKNILSHPYPFIVPQYKEVKLKIPVHVDLKMEPGIEQGEISLIFDSVSIQPNFFTLDIKVKGYLANNIWIIPFIILLIAAIVVGILFLINELQKTLKLKILIEKAPLQNPIIKLKEGQALFLAVSDHGFEIERQTKNHKLAKISHSKSNLKLQLYDSKAFADPKETAKNMLNQSCVIIMPDGQETKIEFLKA